jgi:hypothetical protein
MQQPSTKPAPKPGEVDEEAAARKPDVQVGDEVFFNHPAGPMSGRVTAAGEHGATIDAAGVTHKIKWPHIVGHKKRAEQHYTIAESGEDGHIVTDQRGRRIFLLIPNQATEDPLMAKAVGTPYQGRAGLSKKIITEKTTGRQVTHYVKTSKDEPKGRKKAAPDEAGGVPKDAPEVGSDVSFKAGDFAGKGKVVSSGPQGATVRDSTGRDHQVHWGEIDEKPNYAPRNEGENDKGYAKRVVDHMPPPRKLPEEHEKYFDTKGAATVPMENLHSTKTDEENKEGGDNAPKRMQAAAHGMLAKRPPISVEPHPTKKGHYNVMDGNGTFTAAKKAGWKHMPVNIMGAGAAKADARAKELAKAVIDPADPKYAGLPVKATQPSNEKDELLKLSAAGLEELKDWLNRNKGVASKAGCRSMTKGPDDVTDEEWAQPGGMLFIATLKTASAKGMIRAQQKVDGKGGNWNTLTDIVRCTIATDSLDDMHALMKSLDASGMKVAQQPKNRFLKPTDEGYMDINLVVTMNNGTQAEVQLNVKDMMKAKNDGHHFYEITRVIDEKYEKRPDREQVLPPDWEPGDYDEHQAAYKEQVRIYGKAYADHIQKYYGGDESKMVKSLILLCPRMRR